jgi:hypothetical protein
MRYPACLAALVTLLGCGGNAPYATTLTASSPSPAPDVLQCARDQLKAINFVQTSIDVEDTRLTARKFDETVRRPDVQFRRLVDRLEIEATPATDGAVTTLKITPRTFGEYTTQRGPTEEQEKTSTTAQAAAQTLLKTCTQPVDSTSVPG